MAVGVVFAGFLAGNAGIALFEAIILAIGIAIQNIPEGAIISMPLKMKGETKKKAFISGVLSGIVEPIAGFATIMLINIVVPCLPYLLSFAAGAMIFVVIEELVPEIHEGKKSAIRCNRSNYWICNYDGIRYSTWMKLLDKPDIRIYNDLSSI
jgi:ZIP family zinc transporter